MKNGFMKNCKRILAIVLSLGMTISLLPANVYADEANTSDITVESEYMPDEAETLEASYEKTTDGGEMDNEIQESASLEQSSDDENDDELSNEIEDEQIEAEMLESELDNQDETIEVVPLPNYGLDNSNSVKWEDVGNVSIISDDGESIQSDGLPSSFTDLSDIPNTRDQNPYGTCWAHTAIALAEINMIKQGKVNRDADYSELHLAYNAYHQYNDRLGGLNGDSNVIKPGKEYLNAGGNVGNAGNVLFNWVGAASESVAPYSSASNSYTVSDDDKFNDVAHITDYYVVNPVSNIEAAKALIYEYGAIGIDFCALDEGKINEIKIGDEIIDVDFSSVYSGEYNCYYLGNDKITDKCANHAVTAVGWDDNFSKENFVTQPESDGAWLIRNSWTTKNAESYDGYFWLSYYDKSISDTSYAYKFGSYDNYDNNHQYDGSFIIGTYSPFDNYLKTANKFTVSSDNGERLKAVAFATDAANVEYTIDIYTEFDDNGYPSDEGISKSVTGFIQYPGYHTVELTEPVDLKPSEEFAVAITLKKESKYYACQIEMDHNAPESNYTSKASSKEGQSYWFNYGVGGWSDRSERDNNNFRIKAFTDDIDLPSDDPEDDPSKCPEKPDPVAETVGDMEIVISWPVTDETVEYILYESWDGKWDEEGLDYYLLVGEDGYEFNNMVIDGQKYYIYRYSVGNISDDKDFYFRVAAVKDGLESCSDVLSVTVNPHKTLSFDANGGVCDTQEITIKKGLAFGCFNEDKLPVPMRTGYSFVGWFTLADGGAEVKCDDTVTESLDVTLYAHWEANNYNIIYHGNGEDAGTVDSQECSYDQETNIKTNQFEKDGCTFIGWNTKSDGTGTTYAAGSRVINLTDEPGGKIELYARWKDTSEVQETMGDALDIVDVLPEEVTAVEGYYWVTYQGMKWDVPEVPYTGANVTLSGYELYFGNKRLTEGKDYSVKYSNNKNAATYDEINIKTGVSIAPTITFTGKGNYSGTLSKTFTITPKNDDAIKATTSNIFINGKDKDNLENYLYAGYESEQSVVDVYYKKDKKTEAVLIDPSKYTVTYSNNINASKKAEITVTFTGNSYYGSVTKKYTIQPYSVQTNEVTINNISLSTQASSIPGDGDEGYLVGSKGEKICRVGNVSYAPGNPKPEIQVSDALGNVLLAGTDYTLSAIKSSTVTIDGVKTVFKNSVVLTGKGNYTGSMIIAYDLNKSDLENLYNDGLLKYSYTTPLFENKNGNYKLTDLKLWGINGANTVALRLGTDYTVRYYALDSENNEIIGGELGAKDNVSSNSSILCKVEAKGDKYAGSLDIIYNMPMNYVFSDDGTVPEVDVDVKDIIWKDKANICKPSITVTAHSTGKKLRAGTDYEVCGYYYTKDTYVVQIGAGGQKGAVHRIAGDPVYINDIVPPSTEIEVALRGKGKYDPSNSVTATFRYAYDLSKAKVTIADKLYTGKPIELEKNEINVKLVTENFADGKVPSNNFVIESYSSNISKGTVQVVLKGCGLCTGINKAKFKIVDNSMNYMIIYDANGGTATSSMKNSSASSGAKLSKNAYIAPQGYEFWGWSLKAYEAPTNLEDYEYHEPDFIANTPTAQPVLNMGNVVSRINISQYPVGSALTLYSTWRPIRYDITYKLNGGVNNSYNLSYYDSKSGLRLYEPQRNGYSFAGWYLDSKFTQPVDIDWYSGVAFKGETGKKTIYAKWMVHRSDYRAYRFTDAYVYNVGAEKFDNDTKDTYHTSDAKMVLESTCDVNDGTTFWGQGLRILDTKGNVLLNHKPVYCEKSNISNPLFHAKLEISDNRFNGIEYTRYDYWCGDEKISCPEGRKNRYYILQSSADMLAGEWLVLQFYRFDTDKNGKQVMVILDETVIKVRDLR